MPAFATSGFPIINVAIEPPFCPAYPLFIRFSLKNPLPRVVSRWPTSSHGISPPPSRSTGTANKSHRIAIVSSDKVNEDTPGKTAMIDRVTLTLLFS